jgi:hypothetical protein
MQKVRRGWDGVANFCLISIDTMSENYLHLIKEDTTSLGRYSPCTVRAIIHL